MDREQSVQHFLDLLKKYRRGNFKIYIGMIAGVGKSYRMLSDAHQLLESGIDVNFRMDTENRLQVHLFDLFSFIKYLAAGDDRQSFHQCLRLDSPMCFYITDLDIDTAFQ